MAKRLITRLLPLAVIVGVIWVVRAALLARSSAERSAPLPQRADWPPRPEAAVPEAAVREMTVAEAAIPEAAVPEMAVEQVASAPERKTATEPDQAPEPDSVAKSHPAAEPAASSATLPPLPAPPAARKPAAPLRDVRERLASIAIDSTNSSSPRWVEPCGGDCPETHPVKAKLRSHLFHLPGMLAYERTGPDRCYRTSSDAEADGFVRAKR